MGVGFDADAEGLGIGLGDHAGITPKPRAVSLPSRPPMAKATAVTATIPLSPNQELA